MNLEELQTCRDLLAMHQDENGEVAEYWGKMLAHIDAQSAQISFLDSRCNDLLEANEALKHEFMESNVLDLKRQIIELSDSAVREESKKDEQIEALKEKLVEERAILILRRQHDFCHNYSFTITEGRKLARQQLAEELPEAFRDG